MKKRILILLCAACFVSLFPIVHATVLSWSKNTETEAIPILTGRHLLQKDDQNQWYSLIPEKDGIIEVESADIGQYNLFLLWTGKGSERAHVFSSYNVEKGLTHAEIPVKAGEPLLVNINLFSTVENQAFWKIGFKTETSTEDIDHQSFGICLSGSSLFIEWPDAEEMLDVMILAESGIILKHLQGLSTDSFYIGELPNNVYIIRAASSKKVESKLLQVWK